MLAIRSGVEFLQDALHRAIKHLFRAADNKGAPYGTNPVCQFGPGGEFVSTWPRDRCTCKPREHVKGIVTTTSVPTPAGAPYPRRGQPLFTSETPLCIFGPGGEFTTAIYPHQPRKES